MRIWSVLLLSLCLHILATLLLMAVPALPEREEKNLLQVEYRPDAPETGLPQFVRTDDVPEEEKLKKQILDKVQFLSDRIQRVEKQMQARNKGMTQNARNSSSAQKFSEKTTQSDLTGTTQWSAMTQQPPAQSQLGTTLPDSIGVGEITALNADRFTFSSFFLRFEELVRFRWEQNVYQAVMRTPSSIFIKSLDPRWRTDIEVQVHPNGELKKVVLFKSAGLPAFDQAVIRALQDARLFPNPPRELIDKDDGLIHLRFSFTVHTDPAAIARRF